MQRILITALTLAVLVYALVLGVKWLSPRIEQNLANRITTELAKDGQLWVTPSVSSREVTLSGEAPTPEAKAAARAAVARVFGIAKVHDLITLPGQVVSNGLIISASTPVVAPKLSHAEQRALAVQQGAYRLSIRKDGDILMLAGNVPDDAAKDLLITLAKIHYPEAQLNTTSLTVVTTGAPAGWRSAAGTVLYNLVNLEQGEATLVGREVMISGTVLSPDFASNTESAIRTTLPTQYTLAFAVDTDAPLVAPLVVASATTPGVPAVSPSAPAADVPAYAPAAVAVSASVIKPQASVQHPVQPHVTTPTAVVKPAATVAHTAQAQTVKVEDSCSLAQLGHESLRFAFNSAKVRGADQAVVARVAGAIKGCPSTAVLLKGYSDKTGSATYNQWLSQQRADAALRALVREGVARQALTAKGYGETNQFGSQENVKTRAENRRVEFSPLSNGR